MGKAQKKTGKGRLDKYYKLAKEQGYRARSAFKLVQLNKKYNFLQSARCCIDLCAAPGGWLQVSSKYMPPNSIIVGVDLVPIKPIPRVITFAADITTSQCRNLIRGELKDWKADVVLHDGAPNVGTAWVQDAYSQAELVLMSLKLAVEFLIKGGTFVTKVFRSADYNNLLWVFNQLFGKVEATKPPSSRNVSAEIFVVCREYLAPKQIDPRFLDPKHVFKDLSLSAPSNEKNIGANAQVNVFQPEKKRRHRDGYDEGDYTLFKKTTAGELVRGSDPVALLGSVNRITFETEEEKEWLTLDVTTPDVKANCDDLKVLGKGDFKALMKWRTLLRLEIGLDVKAQPAEELTEKVQIVEEVDEEQDIQNELERLNAIAAAKSKRVRKKNNESKQRTIRRMQLRLTAPLDEQNDAALQNGEEDYFDLGELEQKGKRLRSGSYDEGSDESEAEGIDSDGVDVDANDSNKVAGLEAELDGLYAAYQERLGERDTKQKAREKLAKRRDREEWGGIKAAGSDEESGSDEEGGWDLMEEAKAANDESSSASESEDESDEDELQPGGKRKLESAVTASSKKKRLLTDLDDGKSKPASLWFAQDIFKDVDMDVVEDESEGVDSDEENHEDVPSEAEDDIEIVPQDKDDDINMWDADDANEDELKRAEIARNGLKTAEAVTLAQQLVNREKTKAQLIDEGFSRYSLNAKDGLPTWFLDDESKHYKSNLPVTKEAMDMLRARQRALDARPIKKVAEAKARKKMKAVQKLQKALKKAEGVNDSTDMPEREKAKQIQKLMRKGASSSKKSEVKRVVAKGTNRGLKGRPKGVKGRYQMIDSRMKKEVRAKKRKEKANKKRS